MKKHNWKIGSLHCHTLWSDGRNMPETVLTSYRQEGYDFVCLSDHNFSQQDPERWMEVKHEEGPWPPNLCQEEWARCQELCPGMVESKEGGYRTFVRLNTLSRLRELFEEKGKFLIVGGTELTSSFKGYESMPEGSSRACHMNIFNLENIFPEPKGSLKEIVEKGLAMYKEAAAKSENPSFFMMNHPFYLCWDIDPAILLDYPQIKFFEVCNSGSKALENNPDIPVTPDSYWDFILAHRLDRGEGIIYGTGVDDAHYADLARRHVSGGIGTGFVVVDCGNDFSYNGIAKAMLKGDFYSSSGVMLQEVEFDKETKTLSLKVQPKEGANYKIRFVTTKKDFDRTIQKAFYKGNTPPFDREVTVIPESIGVTVKEVEGTSASYTMQEDELYIRAIIYSDIPGRIHPPVPPAYPEMEQAWTQPFC